MNAKEIALTRIQHQHIGGRKFHSPGEIVKWMGAIQAQDFSMAKWAIGIRLPGITQSDVEQSFNDALILRTHLLRPTWHIVSASDIRWILRLTAPRIKAAMQSRNRQLELTSSLFRKSNRLIEKTLSDGNSLTRDEMLDKFREHKIPTDENRFSHLLMEAELDGIICSGTISGNKPTYALLSHRVPETSYPGHEESLAMLAKRYFLSRGPATLKDFIWWSGLSVKDAKAGLELIKQKLVSASFNDEQYWFADSYSGPDKPEEKAYLLPAFDEFILSYRNRTASLNLTHHKKAVSENGIFRPVVVIDSQVAGLWKRITGKDSIMLETVLFQKEKKSTITLISKAGNAFEHYINKVTRMKILQEPH